MFPGGINPRNMDPKTMQRLMHQFGIKNQEIDAERVIIEGKGGRIVIEPASVTAIDFGGRKTYTVVGEERREQAEQRISEDDIEMVVKQAGVTKKKAEAALRKNEGDIAGAILELKGEK
ncbi:MAG: nascent polypeptide-associated complex protein [Candidatus Diapherotrites archaeon]|nr:nascent polypeptide-associated complex protein [Candidatus Diapherotrites archaeon]